MTLPRYFSLILLSLPRSTGTVQKVLFGGLVTCGWYKATQEERGQQAKHNCLLVVYLSKHQQFLAPVNPQIREKDSELIDMVGHRNSHVCRDYNTSLCKAYVKIVIHH